MLQGIPTSDCSEEHRRSLGQMRVTSQTTRSPSTLLSTFSTQKKHCEAQRLPPQSWSNRSGANVSIYVASDVRAAFELLSARLEPSGRVRVCAQTAAAFSPDCYRTRISAKLVYTWQFGNSSTSRTSDVAFAVHLADLNGVWPHYGKPQTPEVFSREMQEVHRRWDGRVSFGRNQTVAIFDAGWWAPPSHAGHLTRKDSATFTDMLNAATVTDWASLMTAGPKCIAAFDAVQQAHGPMQCTAFGHGEAIYKLLAGKSRFSDGDVSTLGLGVAYNAQVLMVRGYVNKLGEFEKQAQRIEDVAKTLREALRFVIANHRRFRITHVHISHVERKVRSDANYSQFMTFDDELLALRRLGISVVAPAGNVCQQKDSAVNWPAMHPLITSVGVLLPQSPWGPPGRTCAAKQTDIAVRSSAHTSSSAAYMSAFFLILREALLLSQSKDWRELGSTLPEAILSVLRSTGGNYANPRGHPWNLTFALLDRALSFILEN